MARIELRDTTVRIKDGLAGTAAINDGGVMAGDGTEGEGRSVGVSCCRIASTSITTSSALCGRSAGFLAIRRRIRLHVASLKLGMMLRGCGGAS